MKLNKYTKQGIVRAILQDLPKVDKTKRRADLQAAIVKAMSPAARKLYKDTPEALRTEFVGSLVYDGNYGSRDLVVGDVNKDTIKALCKPYEAEDEARHQAEWQLKNAIDGCSTLNALKKALPEFEKYYPTANEPTKNLPAMANVVADLSRLGWPKGEKA